MSDLKGQTGELRGTIHITRKATGKVETFEVVAHTNAEQHEKIMRTHGTSGALTGQLGGINNHPKE